MERAIFKIVILSTVCGVIGKHVYVMELKTWDKAQQHCRHHFTDLSPISSYRDTEKLREASVAAGNMFAFQDGAWIGLYREPKNFTGWRWSGGGNVTYQNWVRGHPESDPDAGENYGEVTGLWGMWHSHLGAELRPFFCLKWIVVKEKKTWQEAMWYCKEHHTDLISLVSETEVLLAMREMRRNETTDLVWTGLRYFGKEWLWVNGDPLDYRGSPFSLDDKDHQCPSWSHGCGALNKTGQWQTHSCQEKLNFICY